MFRLALLCLLVAACRAGAPAADKSQAADKPLAPPAPAEASAKPEPVVAAAAPVVADAAPAAAEPEADESCSVEGFVLEERSGGLPVRAEPSEEADIMGGIWAWEEGTVLELMRGRDGWVEVQRARQIDGSAYNVEGWLSGQLVGTDVRCPDENPGPDCAFALRAAPELGAAQGRRVPAGERVKIIGCRGDWVQVETTEEAPAERARGWLAPKAQCPNPVSSCP